MKSPVFNRHERHGLNTPQENSPAVTPDQATPDTPSEHDAWGFAINSPLIGGTISDLRARIDGRLLGDGIPPAGAPIDFEREGVLEALVAMLRESELGTNDLRFLFVVTTMALAIPPARLFEQLRTSGASSPPSDAQ